MIAKCLNRYCGNLFHTSALGEQPCPKCGGSNLKNGSREANRIRREMRKELRS